MLYLLGTFYQMTIGIDAPTLIEKHLTITAFATTHKEYKVVALGKSTDIGHAIGHLAAYRIETFEIGFR